MSVTVNCVLSGRWDAGKGDRTEPGILDGWYFFDEVGEEEGPFSTKEEAEQAARDYSKHML